MAIQCMPPEIFRTSLKVLVQVFLHVSLDTTSSGKKTYHFYDLTIQPEPVKHVWRIGPRGKTNVATPMQIPVSECMS